MRYFKHFPIINYNNNLSTNIMVRGIIRNMILDKSVTYYPYIVRDEDRPDIIAHKYYGSSDHVWLVFYANNIFHPIFDWTLPQKDFLEFIKGKYGNLEDPQITTHQYKRLSDGLIIDEDSYNILPENNRKIITQFEYELEKNEAKRNIKIIDSLYLSGILTELRRLF